MACILVFPILKIVTENKTYGEHMFYALHKTYAFYFSQGKIKRTKSLLINIKNKIIIIFFKKP